MSAISTTIRQYKDGKLTKAELVEKLGNRTYPTPERMKHPVTEPDWLNKYPWYQDGTWDEVSKAHVLGLLSDNDYSDLQAAQERFVKAKADYGPEKATA